MPGHLQLSLCDGGELEIADFHNLWYVLCKLFNQSRNTPWIASLLLPSAALPPPTSAAPPAQCKPLLLRLLRLSALVHPGSVSLILYCFVLLSFLAFRTCTCFCPQRQFELRISYLFRLLSDLNDADTGVRWGALASVVSFAVVRALSSSDYVGVRCVALNHNQISRDILLILLKGRLLGGRFR